MKIRRKALAALTIGLMPLGGCVVVPDAPNVAGTPWPAGSEVPLGQPVEVGEVAVTPLRIVEDSRCPTDTTCVWEGRLLVRTRIDGDGWRDTTDIKLGDSYGTHGKVVKLVAAIPDKVSETEIPERQYRFTYEDGTWHVGNE